MNQNHNKAIRCYFQVLVNLKNVSTPSRQKKDEPQEL